VKDNTKIFILSGLLVAIGLALLVSPFASSSPDGLNKVAIDKGFDEQQEAHAFEESPLAGYVVKGVDGKRMSKGLSGLIGVLITFGGGLALFATLRSFRARNEGGSPRGAS
jgi:hypothetical protein